jgi:MoxR-like ATPase
LPYVRRARIEILETENIETEKVGQLRKKVVDEVSKVVVGRTAEVNLLLVCLLSRGHVLLEGVPGISKTLLAKSFSKCLDLKFKRVQFTPDMLPLDIIGGYIFNLKNREFEFKEGPIFTNILLADEINRAAPKVQSALLEAMQEIQVTVEGNTTKLPFPFMVIATQNPLDFEGVYPLPESELDRFTMKINFGYPTSKIESDILERNLSELDLEQISAVITNAQLNELFMKTSEVHVSKDILRYVVELGENSRSDSRIGLGASPRALVQLVHVARANAVLDERNYVIPEDIKLLATHVLSHRIRVDRAAALKGLAGTSDSLIKELLGLVSPPR